MPRPLAVPVVLFVFLLALSSSPARADEPDPWAPILPPVHPWDGASRSLIAAADDPWITPAESTGFRLTPSADATREWLERLAAASPRVRLETFGTSGEGRDLLLVVAGREGSLEDLRDSTDRPPVVLAQAGIHSGEIDGKDAGMMLLRDLTVAGADGGENLLGRVTLLFVPILNPDGHERVEPYGRLNQRGPENAGWRTNARNLNLNRDWTKLDTPEVRALVGVLRDWDPELWIDLHVTDGSDYLYDVTWGHVGPQTWSPAGAAWLRDRFDPTLAAALRAAGHDPGPLVFAADWDDPWKGLQDWEAPPRFSDGYGDLRHQPTILVENHSLEPYERRVLGTRVFLEEVLELVATEGAALRAAIGADRARRAPESILGWELADEPTVRWIEEFRGTVGRRIPSPIGGDERSEWTGEPRIERLAVQVPDRPVATVVRPAAYWVPAAWAEVLEVLTTHGVRTERSAGAAARDLERLWLVAPELDGEVFEGRVRVEAGVRAERFRSAPPPGAVRVSTDQPLGDLAIHLLEPEAPDSLFRWGFFHSVLQRTEYTEEYVLDPVAERLLETDPQLREAWEEALADPDFAADPMARREWWYGRSPWVDPRWRLYPVLRERAVEAPDAGS